MGKHAQEEQFEVLLKLIELGSELQYALVEAGLNEDQFYRKRKNDMVFRDRYEVALDQSAIIVENELIKLAKEGDVKAIKLFLEARKAHKYGSRAVVNDGDDDALERLKESAEQVLLPGDRNAVAGKTISGDTVLKDE